jgi:hypothetical protein
MHSRQPGRLLLQPLRGAGPVRQGQCWPPALAALPLPSGWNEGADHGAFAQILRK